MKGTMPNDEMIKELERIIQDHPEACPEAKAMITAAATPQEPWPSTEDVAARCIVCKDAGAVMRSWAPPEIFDDSETWPKDYLCQRCYDKWRTAIKSYYTPVHTITS